jgi:hypothetical protein
MLGNCKKGDHEQCLVTFVPERLVECDCRCHRQAIEPSHRPTARATRVRSRQRNWQGSKWYMNAFPKPPKVTVDETIIRKPTKEELWERMKFNTHL